MLRRRPIEPVFLLLAGALLAPSGHGQDAAVPVQVLLELDEGEQMLEVIPTPDLAHWVAITTFDNVGPGTGGDASSKLGSRRLIHDGKLVGKFRHVPAGNVRFAPDGSRMAFVAVSWGKDDFNKYQVHVDGEPAGDPGHYSGYVEFGAGLGPWFSPDGASVVWPWLWKNRFAVVRDGKSKVGQKFDHLKMRRPFGADGRLAWVAELDGQESLYLDGAVVATADRLRLVRPVPGEDSTDLAWIEGDDEGERFVAAGKSGDAWSRIDEVAFDPKGASVAYSAIDESGREFVVLDGERAGGYDEVSQLGFGPDGQLAFLARKAGRAVVMVGDDESPDFSRIERYEFLIGARAVALVGSNGARRHLMRGDLDTGEWTELGSFARVYSIRPGPAGRVAASVEKMGASRVYLDAERSGPEADEIRHCSLLFTPDVLAFAARKGNRDVFVLDGDVVASFDRVMCPVVLSGSFLEFLALDASALVRVRIPLP